MEPAMLRPIATTRRPKASASRAMLKRGRPSSAISSRSGIKGLPAVEQLPDHQTHRKGDRDADQRLFPNLPLDRAQTVAARGLKIGGHLVQPLLEGIDFRFGPT